MPTLVGEKREGGVSVRKSGRSLSIETTHSYRVKADSKSDSRATIMATSGLPIVGSTLNGPAICTGKTCNRDPANPLYWDVEVTFSTDSEDDSSGASEAAGSDPSTWTPIAELAFETYTEVGLTDASGNPVVNSAGQPFETGFARPRTLVRLDFDQFEPTSVTDEDLIERNETVNNATYKGKAAKTLKLSIRSATIGTYFGYAAWRVSYSLTYKPDTWQRTRLDIGNCYLSSGNLLPYTDNEGNRIVGPLDGSGGKQAAGTSPAVLTFDEYDAINFSSFLRLA